MPEELPSKKQLEVFNYIDSFINENGYGPSYREVMRALELKSVSTVATHVDGLIARGYLVKRENSARSLQVVSRGEGQIPKTTKNGHLDWFRQEIEKRELDEQLAKEAEILKAALQILDQTEEK